MRYVPMFLLFLRSVIDSLVRLPTFLATMCARRLTGVNTRSAPLPVTVNVALRGLYSTVFPIIRVPFDAGLPALRFNYYDPLLPGHEGPQLLLC